MAKPKTIPSKRDVQKLLQTIAFDPRSESAEAILKNKEMFDSVYLMRRSIEELSVLLATKQMPLDQIVNTLDGAMRKLLIARLNLKAN